jgi:hypothetical protein
LAKERLRNEVSTIRLGVEKLENYSLTSSNVNKTEIEGLERNSFTDGKMARKVTRVWVVRFC